MWEGTVSNLRLRVAAAVFLLLVFAAPGIPAIKNAAIVTAAGNKLNDITLADLAKLCKGTQKTWPDGREFTLVIKDPDNPETRIAIQKLFGTTPGEFKTLIAKLNETRQVVKIVDTDDSVMQAVSSTPGAIGLVDVYSINSSVKVLRVDGKLPFDVGYAFKGNT
jgi:ABC-type phosphate transport system substrate-binding protein